MANNRLKSFTCPAQGLDNTLFTKFLYMLMDTYMDDLDNTPDSCIESHIRMEQHFRELAGGDLSPGESDLINELETAYMWYGMYAGIEFYAMLEREVSNISGVAKLLHPDSKISDK